MEPLSLDKRRYRTLCGVLAFFTAALLVYSQTRAFTGDEGFHMLAAQLMHNGLRPYLDFCFPQAPLNAYWNAGWMTLFGDNWRTVHAVAAVVTAAAVFLTADYFFSRFPIGEWRLAGAITAGLLTGLNAMVAEYGPLGQAYGTCLLLLVGAFRFSVAAVEREGLLYPFAAGLLGSTAAGCSLLSAPAGPVLFLWLVFQNRAGSRIAKALAFVAAAAIPWLPVLWLARSGPRNVWFNLIEYHTKFRHLYWPDTTRHDLEIITSWIDSGQALTLGILAIAGLLFIHYRSGWDRPLKAQFYLCAVLAMAISAEHAFAHPTFARYFLLAVPFLALLAAVGLYAIGSRIFAADRPQWPVAVVLVIAVLGLAKSIYERREMYTWGDYEEIARKVNRVTPPNGVLFADEHIYFMTHRRPPSGLEFAYSHKVTLPPAELAKLHIIPQAELDRRLSSGVFDTVYICEDDETYDKLGLPKLYSKKEEIEECMLFSGRKPK